jgi:hypothetical protein
VAKTSIADIQVLRVFYEATLWDKDGEVVLRCGRDTGRVYFAAGKIAWATSSTHDRTFTKYLVEHSHLSAEEVEEVFQDCQRTNRNLAETVVEWGLLDEPSIRRLLLEHMSEVLLEIFSWPAVESMFMPEQRTYGRTLTFEFVEVLDTVNKFDVEGRLPWGRVPSSQLMGELKALDGKQKLLGRNGPLPPAKRSGGGVLLVLGIVFLLLAAAAAAAWIFKEPLLELLGIARVGSSGSTQPADPGRLEPPSKPKDPAPAADSSDAGSPDAGLAPAGTGPSDPVQAGPAGPETASLPAQALPDGIVAGAPGMGSGSIRVTSKPSRARIYLDGVDTGLRTPAVLDSVAAGREHLVLLVAKHRQPVFSKVKLAEGQNAKVRLNPGRKKRAWRGLAEVRMLSQPPGAEILYNAKPTGKTTPSELKLPLSKASRIELRLAGHKSWTGVVRPVPGVPISLFGKLPAEPTKTR